MGKINLILLISLLSFTSSYAKNSKYEKISAGRAHSCALNQAGQVYCWGANWQGQLGNGTSSDSSLPVLVSGISGAVEISAGDAHTCARLASGNVKCWGFNLYGQLGDGSSLNSTTPIVARGIASATEIKAYNTYTCAKLKGGTTKCWGDKSVLSLSAQARTNTN